MVGIPIFGTKGSLPKTCGGLTFSAMEIFPDPSHGAAMRYRGSSPFIHADAYLYDLGLPNIPQDLRSDEIFQFHQGACQDVFMMAEMGEYLELKTVTSQFLYLPEDALEPFCLWASFTYRNAPGPDVFFTGRQKSHLALRSDRGFINKVRYTYADSEGLADILFRGFLVFLVEWTTAVQEFSIPVGDA